MPAASFKILFLAAGAGERRAGPDARAAGLVRGLRALGHDVQVAPLHTPAVLDEPLDPDVFRVAARRPDGGVDPAPLFLNAARLRLRIAGATGRHLLRLGGGRWLDHPRFRRWVTRPGNAGQASWRARLAVHLLEGVRGPLADDFQRVLGHFAPFEPDVVLVAGAPFSAFAPAIKETWPGRPVVGLYAGADPVLENLPEPGRGRARRLLRANVRHYDQLWVSGLHQALRATDLLALPAKRVRVVPVGLPGRQFARNAERRRAPFTLGYLAAIAPERGLATLARAFSLLVHARGRDARLFIAGRVLDAAYWRDVDRQLRRDGLAHRVTVFGELDRAGKIAFLRELSVFCETDRGVASEGIACLEALAAGVPVLAPALGGFPELLRQTGGGTLFPPESPALLAETLALFHDDPDTADAFARHGQMSVLRYHSQERAAAEAEEHLRALFR